MSKRNVFILVLAALLLTGFSVALSRRDSRDWRANRSRRLLPFPWQDTTGVDIARPDGSTLSFSRAPGGEWQIELPEGGSDALSSGASESLAALATLTNRDPLPDRAPPAPDKAVTLVAVNQFGQQARLDFGDVQNNVRAAIADGDSSVVYGVNQGLLAFLDWPPERLRNMYLAGAAGGIEPDSVTLAPAPDDPTLTVSLERRPDGWRLTSPVDWPTDPARIDLLLRWLDRLRADSIASENPKNLETYGLDKPTGHIEAVYRLPEGTLRRRVDLGKESGAGGVFAKAQGRTPVFVVPKEALAEIAMIAVRNHPALWRNFYRSRSLDILEGERPVQFRVERLLPEPAVLTLTNNGDDGWEGVLEDGGGSRTFPVDPPNQARPMLPAGALEQALANLRIKSFLADTFAGTDARDAGAEDDDAEKLTAFPAWRLSCRFADGRTSPVLTVHAANAEGSLPCGDPYPEGDAEAKTPSPLPGYPEHAGFAFTLSTSNAVLEAFPNSAAQLCLPPYRYRSRHLLDLPAREFARVTVEKADGVTEYFRRPDEANEQWWKSPDAPEPLTDGNNRFAAMLHALSQLTSEGFVSEGNGDMSEFGLDRPEITAIVYSSPDEGPEEDAGDGRLFTLALGRKTGDAGGHYARLDNGGPVFLVSGKLARALGTFYR